MTERRAIIGVGGAIVGVLGGSAAAANGAPVAGMIAALGALVAGIATVLSAPDPRDTTGPQIVGTSVEQTTGRTDETADTAVATAEDVEDSAVSAPPVAAAAAGFGTPPESSSSPDASSLFGPPPMQPPLLTDPETGLFSGDYFDIAIEARIAAARRHLRPVGVVLLEVVQGLRLNDPKPTDPKVVADAVRATLREADTASRRKDGKFALLLEDTPENGAIWTVERIRRHLVETDASLTVWAGVACYPAHAFDKESIVRAAETALVAAREWHQDRIEVAIGE